MSATQALGLTWPLPDDVDEARLEALLFPARQPSGRLVEAGLFPDAPGLKRKGVTLQLLWAEYVAVHGERGYRYSQYCNRYRQWRDRQKRSLRQIHLAGDKLFIDYCGPTVPIVDRHTGEVRAAQVFVAVLGASSYTYAEATTQSLPDWIASHQRGVGLLRRRAGAADPGQPEVGRQSGRPLRARHQRHLRRHGGALRHRGVAGPAYKPKDKAKAEIGVQVVERWILARLRHHTFFSLAELNRAIAELLPALNERPFQEGQRAAATSSRPSIGQPSSRYRVTPTNTPSGARSKPGIDYHIAVDQRYSVPHNLVGQVLTVRVTATTVEVLHKGPARRQPSAARPRPLRHRACTCPRHRAHREWSPGRFLDWARRSGPVPRRSSSSSSPTDRIPSTATAPASGF